MLSDLEKLLSAVDDVPDAAWDLGPVFDFKNSIQILYLSKSTNNTLVKHPNSSKSI